MTLLLAARLLESDLPLDASGVGPDAAHVGIAFDLAERLRRVADPETAAQIAASLRTAADEVAAAR